MKVKNEEKINNPIVHNVSQSVERIGNKIVLTNKNISESFQEIDDITNIEIKKIKEKIKKK